MKRLLTAVFIAAMLIALGGGCITSQKCAQCPCEDAYIATQMGILQFKKGHFDDKKRYLNKKQVDELIAKMRKQYQRRNSY
jgi:hypothetical protein